MRRPRSIAPGILLTLALSICAAAQTPTPTPADSDVLKIKSDLIQTGVSVTNKKGEFVSGLRLDDFQLFVDGNLVKPMFFEPVRVSSGPQAKNLAKGPTLRSTAALTDISRTMVFVIDDFHMSADSLIRTRRTVQRFIENEMLPSDRIAVVATSGKVGFLQQFTSDKDVLLAACERLAYSQKSSDEVGPPEMTEFEAQTIERGDRDLTNYFVGLTIQAHPGMTRNEAFSFVQARARRILALARSYTQTTLGAIEASAIEAAKFPGRKAIYYFTDGMLLDPGNTNTPDQLRKITSAAARANVVIYSFDAQGLDASFGKAGVESPNMSQLALSVRAADKFERQDASSYLAAKTGGRFIHNTNDLKGNLSAVAEEAFEYYLLAWEPLDDTGNKFHKIEVKVPGRPDLNVGYQTGYLDRRQQDGPGSGPNAASTPSIPASAPITSELPTSLALNYLQLGTEGPSLSATIAVDPSAVTFEQKDSQRMADLEFSVVLYDQNGDQVTSFKTPLQVIAPKAAPGRRQDITYEYRTLLKPGLYQMRVRSRDTRSGRTGAVAAWLEMPETKRLTLSSILLGDVTGKDSATGLVRNVARRFSRDSSLQFLGFIYPPTGGSIDRAKLNIKAEVRQASKTFAAKDATVTNTAADDAQTAYTGNFPIAELPPGHYELRVSVIGIGDKPIVKRTYFEVL